MCANKFHMSGFWLSWLWLLDGTILIKFRKVLLKSLSKALSGNPLRDVCVQENSNARPNYIILKILKVFCCLQGPGPSQKFKIGGNVEYLKAYRFSVSVTLSWKKREYENTCRVWNTLGCFKAVPQSCGVNVAYRYATVFLNSAVTWTKYPTVFLNKHIESINHKWLTSSSTCD